MRNKLKRSKNYKDTTCQSKGQTQPTESTALLLSESSCDDDKTAAEGGSAAGDKYSSNVVAAGISTRETELLQEQKKKPCCTKDIKIAPIFLRQSVSKRSSNGKVGQPVEKKKVPPQREGGGWVKSQIQVSSSTASHLKEKIGFSLSTSRLRVSTSALHKCLEEIKASNPTFPVQEVFSTLQKKASENLQDLGSTGKIQQLSGNSLSVHSLCSLEKLSHNPPKVERSQQNHLKEKRKREDGSSERSSKRLRCSLTAEDPVGVDQCRLSAQCVQESPVVLVKKQPRPSKLSRSHRLRQQSESLKAQSNNCEPNSERADNTESVGQPLMTCDILHRDSKFDDVLWTDKYHPQCSSEVIGNSVQVNKLHSWLKKWKLRADCDERRKREERKDEESSSDLWDCGDFQGEAGTDDNREDPLCNTMLITGPSGVGKTASVYACAQELGFKVFEVNCSSQRSGRHVLSQLTEATQSHLVETLGNDPLKPAYLSNSSCTPKPEPYPGKTVPLKNVISTTKKRTVQNFGRSGRKGKARPATVTLANYFKMKAKADHLHSGGPSPSDKPDSKKSGSSSPGCDQTRPQSKRTATSLILFEEVDVIFNDDVGFLAAIKTFMTTTKRPVILTTNDPLFRERFNCSLEEVIFKTPSVVNVCSYLQLVCLAENMRLELDDVGSLLRLTCGDVRRCLLQLQLWVFSGGGQAPLSSRGLPKAPHHAQYSNDAGGGETSDSCPSPYDTGCTATMLGLQSVTQNQLLNLLKCQYWSETDMNKLLSLLAESWRGGVPLLYTNLELLLPVGANEISVHYLDKVTCSGLLSELATSGTDPHFQQLDRNVSPEKSATNRKSVRNNSRLSRRKYNATVSDNTSPPTSTHKPQSTSSSLSGARSRHPRSINKTGEISSKVETDSLNALTDFFDLMSYLDATLPAAAQRASGSCRPEAFAWTGAEIKDSLLDETSEELDRSWSQERMVDIQAAAEGLGFHRCRWRVREAWTEAQNHSQDLEDKKLETLMERLMFPNTSKRQSLRFGFQLNCTQSVSQKRYELSRMVLSNKSFSLLGNRQAVSVDYMPVLRSICRFHRVQQQKAESVRCLNYLSSVHLGLSKSTFQLLAEDFS